jgi:hypothetical protein
VCAHDDQIGIEIVRGRENTLGWPTDCDAGCCIDSVLPKPARQIVHVLLCSGHERSAIAFGVSAHAECGAEKRVEPESLRRRHYAKHDHCCTRLMREADSLV